MAEGGAAEREMDAEYAGGSDRKMMKKKILSVRAAAIKRVRGRMAMGIVGS